MQGAASTVQQPAPLIPLGSVAASVVVAGVAAVLGLMLAAQHPVWPVLAVSAVFAWAVAAACFPVAWMWVVPACLPWLNFSPWTGWRVTDEFDLLLLATLAGAYGRRAWEQAFEAGALRFDGHTHRFGVSPRRLSASGMFIALVVLTTGVSAWRGWAAWPQPADTSLMAFGSWLFQDEHSPLSSLRLAKSLVGPLLLWPLWRQQVQTDGGPNRVYRLFAWGMCAGLAVVALVALWERAAFPGWLNFSTHYRTTATFWDMHFGGAAIDIYLVASAPFAVWLLVGQRRPGLWLAAAALMVLAVYAVLTTFSRGVYAAVMLPLLFLLVAKMVGDHQAWRRALWQPVGQLKWRGPAGWVLTFVLLSELLIVTVGGTYMRERLSDAEVDLAQRVAHWQRGLALRQSTSDHLWGIGLGRLPWRYANQSSPAEANMTSEPVPTEFPGRAQVLQDKPAGQSAATAFLRLSGPATASELGGLFSVSQQLGKIRLHTLSRPAEPSRNDPSSRKGPAKDQWPLVELQVRSQAPAQVLVKLCEKHLIYEGNCYVQAVRIQPAVKSPPTASAPWQTVRFMLMPYQNLPLEGFLQRSSTLSLSVISPGQQIDIQSVQLSGAGRPMALTNANFAAGMAHWLPGAGSYYLPWHIDNLYLELLIERGWFGAAAIALLLFGAARCLYRAWRLAPLDDASNPKGTVNSPGVSVLPYLAASIAGCCLAGLVSSVLDAPRIATLFFSLLFLALFANFGDKKPQS